MNPSASNEVAAFMNARACPLKSLFLVSSAGGYGGAERSLELLVGELQKTVRLTVFAQDSLHMERLGEILVPPSRLIILPAEGEGFSEKERRKAVAKLIWLGWRLRPDAVLANTQASTKLMARAARWWPRRIRTFFYVRDFQWTGFAEVFKRLPHSRVLIPSLAVIERPDYLRDHLPAVGQRAWTIVPDMAKMPHVASPVEVGSSARVGADEKLSVNRPSAAGENAHADVGEVLHLATVNGFKGHAHLIRAAALLKTTGRELRIGSYGVTDSPGLRRELEGQIDAAGLTGSFTLASYVADPEALLRDCLCVVVTSVSHSGGPETFGRTIVEAWAHAKPVVAFNAGSMPHLIENEIDGLLVTEGDEAALAEALWRIHSDAALRRRLGENGRAKMVRQFELKQVTAQLLGVLGMSR